MQDNNNQGVETYCPICSKPVLKVVESDKEPKTGTIHCANEYMVHVDYKLIKFKNAKHNYYDGQG